MMKSINFNSQKGVALLESLVALLVVALGIFGILSLQIRTMANTQTSVRQAQAIRLVENLSERVRMNPNSFVKEVASGYNIDWNSKGDDKLNCNEGCSPQNLAKVDVAAWKESVQAALPLADAKVFFVNDEKGVEEGARRQLGVLIAWRENESAKNADDDNYSRYFRLGSRDISDTEIQCPEGRTCYLQFIQLAARCVANDNAGPGQAQIYCADGSVQKISGS
ncbi:MAG: type IV pilus modification protein PilV [Brachymonas sp.]|nr:type IV pilus modification protein PilV [Brachymonas sp.]